MPLDAAVCDSNSKDVAGACGIDDGGVVGLDLNRLTGAISALIQRGKID